MNLSLEISQLSLAFNIVVRIVTAIIFLKFIIPLQFKEAQVKNGLLRLRYELLASGIIMFLVNTVGLSIIIFQYFFPENIVNQFANLVTIFNTLGFLMIALIKYKIYHTKYTPAQKKLHEKFNRMEIAAERKKR